MIQFLLGFAGAAVIQMLNLNGKNAVEDEASSEFSYDSIKFWVKYFVLCFAGGILALLIPLSILNKKELGAFTVGLCYEPILAILSLIGQKEIVTKFRTLVRLTKLKSDDLDPKDEQTKRFRSAYEARPKPRTWKNFPLPFRDYLHLMFVTRRSLRTSTKKR